MIYFLHGEVRIGENNDGTGQYYTYCDDGIMSCENYAGSILHSAFSPSLLLFSSPYKQTRLTLEL